MSTFPGRAVVVPFGILFVLAALLALPSPCPAQAPCGAISGTVRDTQGNPLAGWTVRLLDGTGREVASVTTGPGGLYTFPGLACGNYMVYQDIQSGWLQLSPSLATAGAHVVHLASGSLSGLNFRNESGSCQGGLNVQDFLNSGYDDNAGIPLGANQQIPDDDWLLTARFEQDCWTDPPGGTPSPSPPVAADLIVEPPRPAVTFCPLVGQSCPWIRPNPTPPPNNLLPMANSEWVSAWTKIPAPNGWHFYQHCFCLAKAEGVLPPEITFRVSADDAAQILFNGLPVTQTLNPGFKTTHPKPGDRDFRINSGFRVGTNCLTVAVCNDAQVVTGFDIVGQVQAHFAGCCIAPPGGRVCGIKWEDRDRDGVRDAEEPSLSSWTIELAGGGRPSRTVQTAPDGTYCFADVQAGTYTVQERMPAGGGWTQTFPGGGHTVKVPEGGNVQKIDFGNARCPASSDPKVVYAVQGAGDRRLCERVCCKTGESFFSDLCGCGCAPCTKGMGGTLTAANASPGNPGTVCGPSVTFTVSGASSNLVWECASSANGPWSPCTGAPGKPIFNFQDFGPRKRWVRVRSGCLGKVAYSNAIVVDPLCAERSPGNPLPDVIIFDEQEPPRSNG